jgi:hypothetical protein
MTVVTFIIFAIEMSSYPAQDFQRTTLAIKAPLYLNPSSF